MKDELGTLYLQYEESYWYWELIEMLKKIFFTGMLLVIGNGMSFTIVIAIIVQFIYIMVVEKTGPYIRDRDDVVQFVASVQLFFTLLAALMLKLQSNNTVENMNKTDNEMLGIILIIINSSVIVMAVCSIFLATKKGEDCLNRCMKKKTKIEGSKGSSNTNPTKVSPVVGDPKLQNLQEVRKKHGADSEEYKNALKTIEASANSSKDGSN